jgi:SOS-response transcriptional repressor LexA|tara:strand:+ start:120 stop:341 length:222 start_codon:yes stop_codon:yes gene_type:complete
MKILPTRKQKQLLTFIVDFQKLQGISPSYKEMAEAMNMKSLSTAHAMVDRLVERGYLQRTIPGMSRSLHVLQE